MKSFADSGKLDSIKSVRFKDIPDSIKEKILLIIHIESDFTVPFVVTCKIDNKFYTLDGQLSITPHKDRYDHKMDFLDALTVFKTPEQVDKFKNLITRENTKIMCEFMRFFKEEFKSLHLKLVSKQ